MALENLGPRTGLPSALPIGTLLTGAIFIGTLPIGTLPNGAFPIGTHLIGSYSAYTGGPITDNQTHQVCGSIDFCLQIVGPKIKVRK